MTLVRMEKKGAAANPKQGRDLPAPLVSVCLKRVGILGTVGLPTSVPGWAAWPLGSPLPSFPLPLCISQSSPEMTPRAAA